LALQRQVVAIRQRLRRVTFTLLAVLSQTLPALKYTRLTPAAHLQQRLFGLPDEQYSTWWLLVVAALAAGLAPGAVGQGVTLK
jgi:hypothetical protein